MNAELTHIGERPTLRVEPNLDERKITIRDSVYTHPFSWFITDSHGDMCKSGHVSEKETTISLPELKEGVYHFRAQGEVYELSMGLAI